MLSRIDNSVVTLKGSASKQSPQMIPCRI